MGRDALRDEHAGIAFISEVGDRRFGPCEDDIAGGAQGFQGDGLIARQGAELSAAGTARHSGGKNLDHQPAAGFCRDSVGGGKAAFRKAVAIDQKDGRFILGNSGGNLLDFAIGSALAGRW